MPHTTRRRSALPVFFEAQAGPDTCRVHALNNFLGGPTFTAAGFARVCDEFDAAAGLPAGTSRGGYVVDGGGEVTLFGYALRKAGARCDTRPVAVSELPAAAADPRVAGWFVFTPTHVSAVRRMPNGALLNMDSAGGVHELAAGLAEAGHADGDGDVAAVYAELVLEPARSDSKPTCAAAAPAAVSVRGPTSALVT
jgi:hypothetical protein